MLRITQEAVVHFFQLIGIVIIMLTLNPTLTLYSLIPVVFIVIATRIFSKKIRPYYRRIWRRWSSVFSTLSDTISTAVTLWFWAIRVASERPTYPVPATAIFIMQSLNHTKIQNNV
jgi:ABC-type multidrug transport system fused ATPase/permease subunit